ncbi:MAG: 2-amino-4-hydroxy-6-hydroxymethyldihydropteridine diphosphokinase [Prevotella sp.]|nr:2-amino-4-hydroxy-6-hydroxymethyldihydropteridine diphosphokinase [Prevotella sp.]
MHEVYLSLGTNLGNRRRNLRNAIRLLEKNVGSVVLRSSFVETEPWGFASSHRFLNAAVKVVTELSPHELLSATQQIERAMGRTQKSVDGHYHDRIIDIDILYYDDITIADPDLVIPHPLIGERDFVKIPLSEIRDPQTHR